MEPEELSGQLAQVGSSILNAARVELYLHMRFLDLALSSLSYEMDFSVQGVGTDGYRILFHPQYLIQRYEENRQNITRAYLHMVLHCVYRHLMRRGEREEALWNLACDIAMESVIDSLPYRSVRRAVSPFRRSIYREMQRKMKVLTAEGIYRALEGMGLSPGAFGRMQSEFFVDDHKYWPNGTEDPPVAEDLNQRWQDISEKMQTEMESFSKEQAEGSQAMLEQLKVENRERFDYRAFLRKFAVLKEEIQLDMDSFDYVFYSYGLELYGNMPLIEPQEFKEVSKIEDFVIAIDTSMSCSGDLVRTFLEQTYSVLKETESFFRKVNIHIIQCDDKIQSDRLITCEKDLKEYMDSFELIGGGGTDFRPVFEHVAALIDQGAFTRLKGLLYFTDGQGTYPARSPGYDVAFIFMQEDYDDVHVPAWAIKLILEPEDLQEDTNDEQNSLLGGMLP